MTLFSSRLRSRVGATVVALALVAGVGPVTTQAANAAGPNYCTSTEQWQLYYDGYVQVQASYNDSGLHAKNGWLRYLIPGVSDSGRQYTANTASSTSTAVKSKSYRFWDSWDWSVPSTQFSCGYNWW
ncbi:hypothetical protein [Luethyella okanaganae]|uniref:Uncharacterized protein n=1 Tax=Luethyella okanaganae TaxID=69372 RepID=A0ABW1V9F0_9MICO